jgi:hypothetical protein
LRRALCAAAAAAIAAAVLGACGTSPSDESAQTGAGSLPLDARSPLQPQGRRIRVLVQFHRPSLAEASRGHWSVDHEQRYVANLAGEAAATESALRAKHVTLGRPVGFTRVWNGFAATIAARDLPKLRALGLRSEPVRRFYGATTRTTGGPVTLPAAQRKTPGGGRSGRVAVALLDTGVNARAPVLAGRVERGRDTVDHDARPAPGGATERHGTQVATVLVDTLGRYGGRVMSIRVAGVRRDPDTGTKTQYGTTDELLEGLERAVDPNGDGDTADRAPVALIGVNSPYAGFADSPEAEAAKGATQLGTLVVAPAGNEGPRAGTFGTIGSPAAAPEALAVGALEGGGAPALPTVALGLATGDGRLLARGAVLGGVAHPLRAPITGLAGSSQANPRQRGRALGASPLDYFTIAAKARARGRVVVVPARSESGRTPSLATRAAAAQEAGAVALVVCEPDPAHVVPALPDGGARIPVIGLRGDAAAKALDLTDGGDGGLAFVSAPEPATDRAPLRPAPSSSQGPTYTLAPKPDVAAAGVALVPGERPGAEEMIAGTSVAAARVAAIAARLRAGAPKAAPAEIAARLVETAAPHGPALSAGTGVPDLARASALKVVVEPGSVALPRQEADAAFSAQTTLTVRNTGDSTASLTPAAHLPGTQLTLDPDKLAVPAHGTQKLTLVATVSGTGRPAGRLTGSLRLGGATVPISLPVGPAPRAQLSTLRLQRRGAVTTGVRFSAGSARPVGDALAVEPVGDLALKIIDAKGADVRTLTPAGGARDLLPGEYGYTLTRHALNSLRRGQYRFRATAHGPDGGPPTVRTSTPFTAR